MAIFVSVAAYCDPVLPFTLQSALDHAKNPAGLRFGIVDQSPEPLSAPPRGASYMRMDPRDARGPCFARAIAMGFYGGEDWFLQVDSHMDFDDGWDERLVDQARSLMQGRKGVVLTTYPAAFEFVDGKPVHKAFTNRVLACVVSSGAGFMPGNYALRFGATNVETDSPLPGFHVGAGCLFAYGRLALDFPYDPALYFVGEEQSLSLRLFTHGWDIFHPPGMPIYHLYSPTGKDAAAPRPMHWDSEHDRERAFRWNDLEKASQSRLTALVRGLRLGVYGLGTERTLADFAAFSGIDYARRVIESRAYHPLGQAPLGFNASVSLPTTNARRDSWSS